MDRASVHVVIVNWNSGTQLRECLASFAATANDDVALARITVVDNASGDGSAGGLETALPLTVIRNADNRGFAAACNQGAAGSGAEYLLFLNPDTRLMPGSLSCPCAISSPSIMRPWASSASNSLIRMAMWRATRRARRARGR